MKRTIIVAFLFAIALIIGAFIYFVSGVSSVSSPIKKYEYIGNIDQLVIGIRKYTSSNPNVNLKITDTTGSDYGRSAIYMTIEIKSGTNDVEYGWKCKENNEGAKLSKTTIELIEAYDKTNNTGGYIKEAKGVRELVDAFDSSLLISLKKQQNIQLNPL